MKRSWIKRRSKKVDEWAIIRNRLKQEFEERGMTRCEFRLKGCLIDNFLGFAHRHKREWYYNQPELLGDFKQVAVACQNCHDLIEIDKALTEQLFLKLRG
jgi:hypothetical protein